MRNHMRVFILFCLSLTPAWALAQAELEQMQSNLDEGLYGRRRAASVPAW